MKGIILGVDLCDYKSELKVRDLVVIDNIFYTIELIDKRYKKNKDEQDNENCYFVKSLINGSLMNFNREEISKATISIFDSNLYFNTGTRIKLGNISNIDLRNIKYKAILDWDLPNSDVDKMNDLELIDLEFEGYIIEKEVKDHFGVSSVIKYFKLN